MITHMTIPDSLKAQREEVFTTLYKSAFPLVAGYVSKMGGSFEEAKDVFQDALVAYYEKTRVAPLQLRHSARAYLYGIAKHLWHQRYHDKNALPAIGLLTGDATTLQDTGAEHSTPSSGKLLLLLSTAGQQCMQLLRAFYYDKLSMKEMASTYGFSSERSATVQKFKCLEKVKNTVKEKSLSYADFLE
jgi:RNA polymerase sigma factor (sigma-70 family)